jgi:hypothetical protein
VAGLQGVPNLILLEEAVGVPLARAKILKLVDRYIDRIERPAGNLEAGEHTKARRQS